MNKKKLATLIVAGIMTVGVVGGTLAWFTSQDSINNVFNTGSVTDPEDGLDAGIDVEENFPGSTVDEDGNMVYDKPVTPNQTLTKEVWVESKANYDQIVRARVVKNFIDPATGKVVTHWATDSKGKIIYGGLDLQGGQPLNLSYIVLAEGLNGSTEVTPSGWSVQLNSTENSSAQSVTNWYYYNSVVTPHNGNEHGSCKTTDLLKTVTLAKEAGNEYKNLRFDVKVEAESVQGTNGAIADVWENVPQSIKELDPSIKSN